MDPEKQDQAYEYQEDSCFTEFETVDKRHRFIRKVFALLLIYLALTIAVILMFRYIEALGKFVAENSYIFWIALAVVFVIPFIFCCFPQTGRVFPWNIILLTAFALAQGVFLGIATCRFSTDSILFAALLTFVITVALMLFASQTKYDFTTWYPYLFVGLLCLVLFGVFAIIFQSRVLDLLYSLIGGIIICFYIVADTQRIIGGKAYELKEKDYLFGVFILYIDIIILFQHILGLGSAGDS